MPAERTTTTIRVRRLARAGGGGSIAAWATGAAGVALAAGVVWIIVAAVRPLPAPVIAAPKAPPIITTPRGLGQTLAQRDALLDRLASAGNTFAPDHQPWPVETANANADASTDSATEKTPPAAPIARVTPPNINHTGAQASYDAIPVAQAPPPAITRDLKNLRLRGVYKSARGPVALISDIKTQKNRKESHAHRIGETFGAAEWTVVAIDNTGQRVILSRAGVNVELRMYDLGENVARVAARPAPVRQPPKPAVVVYTRTPAQVRADLAAAGLSQADIDELMTLAQEAPIPAVAASPGRAPTASALHAAPQTPAAMADLLKMMSSGQKPSGRAFIPAQLQRKHAEKKRAGDSKRPPNH